MKFFVLLSRLLVLTIISASAFADDNQFTSPTLGFKLTKPTAWNFVSANNYLDKMKEVKWDDPAAQDHWNQALRAPVVVISKFPMSHDGINPNFKVDVKPYGVIPSGMSGKELVTNFVSLSQQRFKNVKLNTPPTDVTLGNQKGGHVKMTYVSRSTTGVDLQLTTHIWVIPMKSYVFIMGASYAPDSKASEEEAMKIAKSISIE